jgi:hypothetical protein
MIENLLIITLNLGHDTWCLCVQQLKKEQKMKTNSNPGSSSYFVHEEKIKKRRRANMDHHPFSK